METTIRPWLDIILGNIQSLQSMFANDIRSIERNNTEKCLWNMNKLE